MAEAGDFGPLWIAAKRQSGGKGRRGREWVSRPGNLFCTGLFPHKGTPASAAQLSFAAALAVHDTITQFRPDADIKIKWPNDVLMNGAKIAGILLESGGAGEQLWVAVGIGLNIGSAPKDTPYPATYLRAGLGQPEHILRTDIKQKLYERFAYWRDAHICGGFEPLRIAWLDRAQGIGSDVTAHLPNQTIKGTALGMDKDGALEVQTPPGKVIKIHAGDVFFS